MKRLLIAALALAYLSVGLSAQALMPNAYAGLFVDQIHSGTAVYYVTPLTPFTMWIWWLPSEKGIMAVEFQIIYPSNVIGITVTVNPLVAAELGDLASGESAAFGDCQMACVWTHQQACYLTDMSPSFIQIVAHPTGGGLNVATCEAGHPIEAATALTPLYLNQSGPIAAEPVSWGVIKGLYR